MNSPVRDTSVLNSPPPPQDEISLTDIASVLLRGWWFIVMLSVIAATAVCVCTIKFVDPMYKSVGALYVSSTREINVSEISQGTFTSSQMLAETYAEILQRRTFLKYISDDTGNIYTGDEIAKMLTVTPINETEILELSVITDDPESAHMILDSIIVHAKDELLRIVKSGSVEIVDEASMPQVPVSPNIPKNTAIGFVAGFVIAAALLILHHMFDTSIKSADDLRNMYPEPVLGEIPLFSAVEKQLGKH